jgi:hypothetical protein
VCLLVMIGVRVDGRKELVALADGFREPSQSWADLMLAEAQWRDHVGGDRPGSLSPADMRTRSRPPARDDRSGARGR